MEDASGKEKESGRGRAKGGMVLGIRNEIRDEEEAEGREREGIIIGNVKYGKERWSDRSVYKW